MGTYLSRLASANAGGIYLTRQGKSQGRRFKPRWGFSHYFPGFTKRKRKVIAKMLKCEWSDRCRKMYQEIHWCVWGCLAGHYARIWWIRIYMLRLPLNIQWGHYVHICRQTGIPFLQQYWKLFLQTQRLEYFELITLGRCTHRTGLFLYAF